MLNIRSWVLSMGISFSGLASRLIHDSMLREPQPLSILIVDEPEPKEPSLHDALKNFLKPVSVEELIGNLAATYYVRELEPPPPPDYAALKRKLWREQRQVFDFHARQPKGVRVRAIPRVRHQPRWRRGRWKAKT